MRCRSCSRGWQDAFARPFVDYMDAIACGACAGRRRHSGDGRASLRRRRRIDWPRFVDSERSRVRLANARERNRTGDSTHGFRQLRRTKRCSARIKTWPNYFAAKVGFRNHWHAACYHARSPEGDTLALTHPRRGHPVPARSASKVYAMKDRCIHAACGCSEKVECHTEGNHHLLVSRIYVPVGRWRRLQHHRCAERPA